MTLALRFTLLMSRWIWALVGKRVTERVPRSRSLYSILWMGSMMKNRWCQYGLLICWSNNQVKAVAVWLTIERQV